MPESALPEEIFRAYDIRGIAGTALSPEVMQSIGGAIASAAMELGERELIVGADARLSSPELSASLKDGILATGCNVLDLGVVPTPLLYFATHTLETASGAMVTASHNPGHYNGVKIVLQRQALSDTRITDLKQRILSGNLRQGRGTLRHHRINDAYIKRITGDIRYRRRYRVVLDCGNGVAGTVAPALFRALGCDVVPLYCEPDGRFPNHHPDPTQSANLADLIARVRAESADLGVALDGDGDRLGLISASGAIINADAMMLAFAQDILPAHAGARIVFDIKSSRRLARLVADGGGEGVLCRSGHSYVKQAMESSGALLGGEYSAHIFFRHRWYGFDDGLYAAARFLELIDRRGISADALLASLPTAYDTPELRIPVEEADKFALMDVLAQGLRLPGATINTLDGIRADFEDGWGLVRASNTSPALVLRFEADSAQRLQSIIGMFRDDIARLCPELPFPLIPGM